MNSTKGQKITDWARQLILLLSHWMNERKLIITADSSYSALELLAALKDKATIITRLRLYTALYEAAAERKVGQVGRKRLPTLKEQLTAGNLSWQKVSIP